ncbi:MAG: flagellar hook-associated protein FlgL [Candidatus Brocadiae bacterium]|nr:flagellar hook-associated protein FlgL [Candidatus Brocadiia bacterium]
MRISSSQITDSALKALQKNTEKLETARQKILDGKNFTRASDAPTEMKKSLAVKVSLQENSRYLKTTDDALSVLEARESTFSQSQDFMLQAKEIAISATNGTLTPQDRNVLAGQVGNILEGMVSIANGKIEDSYAWGGTKTSQQPFSISRNAQGEIIQANYVGNQEENKVAISQNEKMTLSVPGDKAFSSSLDSLIQLRDLLQNKEGLPETEQLKKISASLAGINNASDGILDLAAKIGNSIKHLQTKQSSLQQDSSQKEVHLSQIEDADIPTTVVQMTTAETAYNATLYTISRSNTKSLLDYLG